jgi:Peptidase family M28
MKLLVPILFTLPLLAQQPDTSLNPTVKQIVAAVSQERIAATLKKLEGFGTRYILSSQDDPEHGIGAAKRWIHDELQSYSPRLQVSYQDFSIKKGARRGQVIRDVNLQNIVAILPGTTDKDHYVLVSAHYDSVALIRKPYTGEDQLVAEAVRQGIDADEYRRYLKILPPERDLGPLDFEATADQKISPGVTDDGSGTAAVMELARVMSAYQFDKSIAFVAFAAEEVGLTGSEAYAEQAKKDGMKIEAVLNNDIIGSDVSGNGQSSTNVLRVFSNEPEDGPARELARYTKLIAERYVPSMQVEMVFRGDRFRRGGDHRSFAKAGFAAVRLTSASEYYDNQHTVTDTFANTSVPYATRVARMNAAVLATLGLAPEPPVLNWTWHSGPNKGGHEPMLTRGKSGYDAVLHWLPNTEPDLAGYAVMIRSTTSPAWQREIWVGNVTTYSMPNVSIDDIEIGVKAVDRDGNQSIVSCYLEPTPVGTPPAKKKEQPAATETPARKSDRTRQ